MSYEGSEEISATALNVKHSSVSPPITSMNATSNLQDSMSVVLVNAPSNSSSAQTAAKQPVKYQVSEYFSKGSHPAKKKMRMSKLNVLTFNVYMGMTPYSICYAKQPTKLRH